jgi:hypothetical protein
VIVATQRPRADKGYGFVRDFQITRSPDCQITRFCPKLSGRSQRIRGYGQCRRHVKSVAHACKNPSAKPRSGAGTVGNKKEKINTDLPKAGFSSRAPLCYARAFGRVELVFLILTRHLPFSARCAPILLKCHVQIFHYVKCRRDSTMVARPGTPLHVTRLE